jgi:hypothetical protein
MQSQIVMLLPLALAIAGSAGGAGMPAKEISNKAIRAKIYLPDATHGYYRGTRFDWSGVFGSLEYKGHEYYGPWFTKTDPKVHDFIYHGDEIVAGPCSAITGPVEEFSWKDKALGYDDAKPGGTFIKIGIGVLRRPDAGEYDNYRLYEIADPGKWDIQPKPDSIEFVQTVSDASSGYGYVYTKTVRLMNGRPEMALEHTLKNTGRRPIETSVYDHNFLVLDKQPIGPDFTITVPFDIQAERTLDEKLADVRGTRIVYRKVLQGEDTVFSQLRGFGHSPSDYNIRIENQKLGAGFGVQGDQPLSAMNLWSIRSVLSLEPYVSMSIQPGKEFSWKYSYTYFAK